MMKTMVEALYKQLFFTIIGGHVTIFEVETTKSNSKKEQPGVLYRVIWNYTDHTLQLRHNGRDCVANH